MTKLSQTTAHSSNLIPPPTNAKLENAPLLDLQAGPVTMARLLALVERKARMNAVVARKTHKTAFVGHWGKV